jgi:hypothetical protein
MERGLLVGKAAGAAGGDSRNPAQVAQPTREPDRRIAHADRRSR